MLVYSLKVRESACVRIMWSIRPGNYRIWIETCKTVDTMGKSSKTEDKITVGHCINPDYLSCQQKQPHRAIRALTLGFTGYGDGLEGVRWQGEGRLPSSLKQER